MGAYAFTLCSVLSHTLCSEKLMVKSQSMCLSFSFSQRKAFVEGGHMLEDFKENKSFIISELKYFDSE